MILVRIIHDHHDQITLRRRKKEEENLSCYSHAIYISSICQERSLYLDTTSFTIHLIHGRFISNISSSINFFFFFLHFFFFFKIFFFYNSFHLSEFRFGSFCALQETRTALQSMQFYVQLLIITLPLILLSYLIHSLLLRLPLCF